MRVFGAAILASTLIISSAFAADSSAPLTPGKPAGVKKAQMEGSGPMWGMGLAIAAGGAALVSSGNGNGNGTITTTSGTP